METLTAHTAISQSSPLVRRIEPVSHCGRGRISSGKPMRHAATGFYHVFSVAALLALGQLIAPIARAKDLKLVVEVWGANKYNMLGISDDNGATSVSCPQQFPFTVACIPVPLTGLPNIIAIASQNGSAYTLALTADQTLWSWGLNSVGQLGHGNAGSGSQFNLPGPVAGLRHVIAFSPAGGHNLALKSDGTVWAWGNNDSGQIGDGTVLQRNAPVQVHSITHALAVSGDSDESFAVRNDGTVWAWGVVGAWPADATCAPDSSGNPPDPACHYTPVKLAGLDHVVSMSGRILLKSDGTVWQLADKNNTPAGVQYSIARISKLSNVAVVVDAIDHGLALKWDGTVWAWGSNDSGQLGDGRINDRSEPVQVRGLRNIISLSDGLALALDGRAWAWGGNMFGRLGNGTMTQSTVPVEVQGLGLGTFSVAANGTNSAAIRAVWQ